VLEGVRGGNLARRVLARGLGTDLCHCC
jgi:hypothetical protein